MDADQTACTSSHFDLNKHWHNINWLQCHQTVKKLQARIVKATQEGKPGKVKALQWILTHSFSGRALAVKRVTENKGKNTPGIDQQTWSTPQAKTKAVLSLKRRDYKPQPVRRVYILKTNGKKRPLGIPAIKDRAMQALYLLALEPIAETQADKHSYGFRPERCSADAIERCFKVLCRKDDAEWILEGDIKSCFDEINHDWLMANIPTDKAILKKWLKSGFMEKNILHAVESGTQQGSIISPCLANMTLDGLEKLLSEKYTKNKRNIEKIHLIRYADDWIITGNSKEILEQEIKPTVELFLKARGLQLSPEKTKIIHINEGFDFLGQNVRKYNRKLLIKPSKKNTKNFLNKIRETIKKNKTSTTANLIGLLNPIIVGWVNYHRYIVAKETFNYVDCGIWRALWRWAKRRHPHKNNQWIKEKYFKSIGTQNWVMTEKTGQFLLDGQPKWIVLRKAADTPIKRFTQIKSDANPFDPVWSQYFEGRLTWRIRDSWRGRTKLLNLWLEQEGKCLCCRQLIGKENGWHVHHILPRHKGGKDNPANLALLHPNCHNQLHCRKLTVVKPVSARKH